MRSLPRVSSGVPRALSSPVVGTSSDTSSTPPSGSSTWTSSSSPLSDSTQATTDGEEPHRRRLSPFRIEFGTPPHKILELTDTEEERSGSEISDSPIESIPPSTPQRHVRVYASPGVASSTMRPTSPPPSPSPKRSPPLLLTDGRFDPVAYEQQDSELDLCAKQLASLEDSSEEDDCKVGGRRSYHRSGRSDTSEVSDDSPLSIKRIVKREQLLNRMLNTPPILRPPPPPPRGTSMLKPDEKRDLGKPCPPILIPHAPDGAEQDHTQTEEQRRENLRSALFTELNKYRRDSTSPPPTVPLLFPKVAYCEPQTAPIIPGPDLDLAEQDKELDGPERGNICDACGVNLPMKRTEIIPCGDTVCNRCWSSTIAAVSTTHGKSICPACLFPIDTFRQVLMGDVPPGATIPSLKLSSVTPLGRQPGLKAQTEVLRIDNVSWDITPELVQSFLPSNVLPLDHPSPIHVLLDRFDGRTKDYLYVEVRDVHSARKVLQACQNQYMPGGILTGGRKRPVTLSRVSHQELLREIRPQSQGELHSLLNLCRASVCTPPMTDAYPDSPGRYGQMIPNGVAHFVKSRHGPFHALMSILCKLTGPQSPSYWDLFQVASGAIAALACAISRQKSQQLGDVFYPAVQEDEQEPNEDYKFLQRLQALFNRCFGVQQVAI